MAQPQETPQTKAAEVRVEITDHSHHAIARIIAMLPPTIAQYTVTTDFGRVYLIGVASVEQDEAVEEVPPHHTAPKEDLDPDPHDADRAWAYITTDSPKRLREALCAAMSALCLREGTRAERHVAVLGHLVDECDRHRPLGNDGKHNDLHTLTCGCETKGRDEA